MLQHVRSENRYEALLLRTIDWFLPPHVRQAGAEELHRARVVTALTLSLVAIATSYVPVYLWLGTQVCAVVLGTGAAAGCGLIVLLRCTGRVALVGNLITALYLIVVTVQSCFQGGSAGPKFLWYLPIPSIAVYICSRRWAIFWLLSTLGAMAVFFALNLSGYRFRDDIVHVRDTIYCLHLMGLSAGICLLGWFHESQRNRILRQLKRAKEAAEVATRVKSNFLANMSHELRTPMAAILGFADQVQSSSVSPEERTEAARTIHRNGLHLLHLLNDLLDLSKIEAGTLVTQSDRCRLPDLLIETRRLTECLAAGKDLTVAAELDSDIPEFISTDATRLRQILTNLTANAVKFTRAGQVRLVARSVSAGDETRLELDVIDTGIGMAADQVGRIFNPFEQADTSSTRQFGGTGLGLSISRELARRMGGDIVVVRTAIQGGTTFRLLLPCHGAEGRIATLTPCVTPEGQMASSSAASRQPAPESPLSGLRILVAEDGPDNQRLISMILRKAGATVIVVENGREAVDRILDPQADGFGLVLMDMQMPVMDGYEATRTLRDAGVPIPIVACTAHTMTGNREACLAAGCDDFISKPINREVFVQTLRRHWRDARVLCEASACADASV